MAENEPKIPPYAPYPTFTTFIDTLKSAAVPPRIDREVMPKMAGGTQSHVIHALKFIGLIDRGHATRDGLRALVEAFGSDRWPEAVKKYVLPAFKSIVGDLDTASATGAQLRERFAATGATGATLDKCVRFYVGALKDAKETVSPYFTKPRPAARNSSPKMPRKKPEPAADGNGAAVDKAPKGTIRFPIHIPGKPEGSIVVPDDLAESDLPILDAMVGAVRAYATRKEVTT